MWVVFGLFWALILTGLQMNLHFQPSNFYFSLNLVLLLVIYMALSFPFVRGFVTVLFIAYLTEVFAMASHGSVIIVYLLLYIVLRIVAVGIFAEAYLTKAVWIIPCSIVVNLATDLSVNGASQATAYAPYWLGYLLQGCLDGAAGFLLFVFLDKLLEVWLSHTLRRKGDFDGADLFQMQNEQRKYL